MLNLKIVGVCKMKTSGCPVQMDIKCMEIVFQLKKYAI